MRIEFSPRYLFQVQVKGPKDLQWKTIAASVADRDKAHRMKQQAIKTLEEDYDVVDLTSPYWFDDYN